MRLHFFRTLPNYLKALSLALYADMSQGEISLRAMGLVYTSLLSLVPLLALSFSVLKGFGVHNQLEPLLQQFLAPLGDKATELTQQVLGFVDNVQVGVLGVAGLATLLYTVVSLMQKIEEAFNFMWQVPQPRSLLAQFRDYLSMVLIGPILLFSALGLWSAITRMAIIQTLANIQPFGLLLSTLVALSPALLIILAFTFLYLFIPNTTVKPLAAFGGALIAGISWQIAGWVFATFVVKFGQQTAIYSIFASLFLFMLWLHVGWIIVLTGVRLAYYFHYPEAIYLPRQPKESSIQGRELVATAVLKEIVQRFMSKSPPATLEELRHVIPISRFLISHVLDELVTYGILSRDDQPDTHYLLRVDPQQLTVEEIRRHFWQGDVLQQQQAQQIQVAIGFKQEWLNSLVSQPQRTIRDIIEHSPMPNTKNE